MTTIRDVRPEIRRRYYQASWGAGPEQGRYQGATLDEYVALKRIEFPQATPESAVRTAAADGRPDLAKATTKATFPLPLPDLNEDDMEALSDKHESIFVQKSGALDLDKTIGKKRPRILTCYRNALSGWKALARGDRWLQLHFVQCKTSEKAALAPVLPVGMLRVEMCDDATASLLVASVEATELSVAHERPLDLTAAPARRLQTLAVSADPLSGVRGLKARKLRVLMLGSIASFDEVVELVAANAATLEVLELSVEAPFGPERLPPLPRLRRLGIPSFEALREPWLDFAVDRATFGVRFGGLSSAAAGQPADPGKSAASGQGGTKGRASARKRGGAAAEVRLESWEGHVAPERIAASRALLERAAKELAALGAKATAAQQKKVLQRCVEGLNELDAAEGHFIQTLEAENLSEAIDALAAGTKLKQRVDVADAWRDW
ncbi:MAG: hypothetical protein WKG00_11995 [Polyangiaceae bacterium]